MALHLIKLSVGCDSVEDLRAWIVERARQARARKEPKGHNHITRMVPKRAADLLAGGSLFWVIRGVLSCRQELRDVQPFTDEGGVGRCRLVLDPEVVVVQPRPCRPFQGWRYLQAEDAPADLDVAAPGALMMPEPLRRELRELGLL